MATQRLLSSICIPKRNFITKGNLLSECNVTLLRDFRGGKYFTAGRALSSANLRFDDFENVYKFKSTKELVRSYAILRLCGVNLFVDHSFRVSQTPTDSTKIK